MRKVRSQLGMLLEQPEEWERSKSFDDIANSPHSRQQDHTSRLLEQLQRELAQVKRKLHHFEEEQKRWSLRYSQRLVICSNLLLGLVLFIHRFPRAFKTYRTEKTLHWILKIFLTKQSQKQLTLLNLMMSAFLDASQSSALFFLSAFAFTRRHSWERNLAFYASTLSSMYLAFKARFLPWANYVNVLFNITYTFARYYYLHGLPGVGKLEFL